MSNREKTAYSRCGITIADVEGRYLDANPAFCELTGYSREELLRMRIADLEVVESPQGVLEHIGKLLQNGGDRFITRHRRKDGRLIDVEITSFADQGRLLAFVIDLEESRRFEEALRASEESYRELFDTLHDAVVIFDAATGGVRDINFRMAEMYGYSYEEALKLKVEDCSAEEPHVTRETARRLIAMAAAGEPQLFEWPARHKTGRSFWVEVSLKRVNFGGRVCVIAIERDITGRKQSEQQLLEYQGQLQRLAAQLSLVEERERRALAGQLHDTVAQSLATAKIMLNSLRGCIPPDRLSLFENTVALVQEAISQSRAVLYRLTPSVLQELGLETALASLVSDMSEENRFCGHFEWSGDRPALDEDLGMFLYSAARELLRNVVKHANANRADVRVRCGRERFEVVVEDDGAGFDASQCARLPNCGGGFGLFGIQERLRHFNGDLRVESEPGRGTRVSLSLPL